MKTLDKYIVPVASIIITILLWIYLQNTQQFIFHYREQHQLFLYDYSFLKSTLFQVGGLAQICAMYLVQFFSESFWGALITACCATAIASFIGLGIKKLFNIPTFFMPICYIPPLLQICALTDTYFSYTSFTAMLIVSFLFYICSLLFSKKRIIIFTIAVICLCFIAYLTAYQPNDYYEPLLKAPSYCSWGWIAMIVCLVLGFLIRYIPHLSNMVKLLVSVALIISILLGFLKINTQRIDPSNYKFLELNSYVINSNWDKVIETCNHIELNNTLYLNYLNLALSHKNLLLQQLFTYPQNGVKSLLCDYQKIPDIIQLQSFIYYQMGNVAAAQNTAFSVSVCNRLGSPSALQMLVKTNIAYGAYKVAEKYIAQLEKTWKYKSWASYYRSLLTKEQKLAEDKEIVNLRKCLTTQDHFAVALGVDADLDLIVEANPENEAAKEYLISMLLLSKNNENIRYFVDKYTGTSVLAEVPEILQEAIYSIAEQEPEYLRAHGVSDAVFDKYDSFYNKFMQSRNAKRNPAIDLKREYGKTYWFYLMFNK